MKNLARIRWVLFVAASGSTAAAGLFVGCSSDDTEVHPPPPDGSTDGTIDGQGDTGTGTDTGSDGGSDTGLDSGLDSTTNFDVGPPTRQGYVGQIAKLYCLKLATCCGGDNFDYAGCEAAYGNEPAPGPGLNVEVARYLTNDAGKMQLDDAKAQQCFVDINRLSCGEVSPETFKQIHADCLAGAVGTIPLGGTGCTGSPECAPPNHCDKPDGGATGTCTAPRAANAECDLGYYNFDGTGRVGGNYYEPQAQCGYLLTGDPGYCANADTYVGYRDGTRKCSPTVANDERCWVNVECQSRFCVDIDCPDDGGDCQPGFCRSQDTIGTQTICNGFQRTTDGGTNPVQPNQIKSNQTGGPGLLHRARTAAEEAR